MVVDDAGWFGLDCRAARRFAGLLCESTGAWRWAAHSAFVSTRAGAERAGGVFQPDTLFAGGDLAGRRGQRSGFDVSGAGAGECPYLHPDWTVAAGHPGAGGDGQVLFPRGLRGGDHALWIQFSLWRGWNDDVVFGRVRCPFDRRLLPGAIEGGRSDVCARSIADNRRVGIQAGGDSVALLCRGCLSGGSARRHGHVGIRAQVRRHPCPCAGAFAHRVEVWRGVVLVDLGDGGGDDARREHARPDAAQRKADAGVFERGALGLHAGGPVGRAGFAGESFGRSAVERIDGGTLLYGGLCGDEPRRVCGAFALSQAGRGRRGCS